MLVVMQQLRQQHTAIIPIATKTAPYSRYTHLTTGPGRLPEFYSGMAGMTLEQKLESSRQTYELIRQRIIERYGAAMVKTPSPDLYEFSMEWTPKQGGRQFWLQVRVTVKGGLRGSQGLL